MAIRSAEECINRILRDVAKRKKTNILEFDNRNVVRRYNAAMERIIENANYLCEHYPGQMDMYMELVNHPDYETAATCTTVLFRLKSGTREHKLAAIESARRLLNLAEEDSIAKYAWSVNIDRWEREMAAQA